MNALGAVIRFKVLCTAVAILYWGLFALLLLSPDTLFQMLGIPGSATAAFIARRAAMLMAGFGVLATLGRNVSDLAARRAICAAVSVSMIGLAMTGIHALQTGFVSRGIVGPIIIESAFALLFLLAMITQRPGAAAQV